MGRPRRTIGDTIEDIQAWLCVLGCVVIVACVIAGVAGWTVR